jgi:hypothetical protein
MCIEKNVKNKLCSLSDETSEERPLRRPLLRHLGMEQETWQYADIENAEWHFRTEDLGPGARVKLNARISGA